MQLRKNRLLFPLGFGCVLACLNVSGCTRKVDSTPTALLSTVRVSLGAQNQQGNGPVGNPAQTTPGSGIVDRADISDDGRLVAFASTASNLVPNDNNNASDVFLRDNVAQTTTLVSVNAAGTAPANSASWSPSISGDGRYVAFISTATDISPDKSDGIQDIFVRDMVAGTTTLVSRASGSVGVKSNGNSFAPRIAKGGRYIVFHTRATNLDPADSDTFFDVYRRDFGDPTGITFATILISRQSGSTPAGVANGPKGTGGAGVNGSFNPSVSRDGHLIAYESDCFNIVLTTNEGGPLQYSPQTTTVSNIYLRDATANTSLRLSLSSNGATLDPNASSQHATISGDGSSVTFQSSASNIVAKSDKNPDIYWRSVTTPVNATGTEIVSVHTSGVRAGSGCDFPVITDDGSVIVWDSPSTTLVDNDTNGVKDVFSHDRNTGITSRVSVATFGGQLDSQSLMPSVTGNGLYVVFYSEADNASDTDTNGTSDYFVRGPPFSN